MHHSLKTGTRCRSSRSGWMMSCERNHVLDSAMITSKQLAIKSMSCRPVINARNGSPTSGKGAQVIDRTLEIGQVRNHVPTTTWFFTPTGA